MDEKRFYEKITDLESWRGEGRLDRATISFKISGLLHCSEGGSSDGIM